MSKHAPQGSESVDELTTEETVYEELKPHEPAFERMADLGGPLSDRARAALLYIEAYERAHQP